MGNLKVLAWLFAFPLALLIFQCTSYQAAPMDKALDAYDRSEFQIAMQLLKPLAQNGDADAQYLLGQMYFQGQGVLRDNKEAARWYQSAADQGNPSAQNNLGWLYENGLGVEQDYKEAMHLYLLAADKGIAQAQCNLGAMHQLGLGISLDYSKALQWYQKSAKQRFLKAQFNLGFMYSNGLGVSMNYTEAAKWYRLSAEQGSARGQCALGVMYETGQGVSQDYKEAVSWYNKAANQGLADAQYNLGLLYSSGKEVPQNYSIAAQWYRDAADQGFAKAQYHLGALYEHGQGVDKDFDQAVQWYRAAIENDKNDAVFYCALGNIFFQQGQYEKAIANLNKSIGIKISQESFYKFRGNPYEIEKLHGHEISDSIQAAEINPRSVCAYNLKAWILATCVKKKYRDGEKAIELAKKAVDISPSPPYWDTLAAAYAEAGRFDNAIATQEVAISILQNAKERDELKSTYEERLKSYQALKPWRE